MGCASIEIMLDTGSMINVPVDRNELWYVNMATMVFGILELPLREEEDFQSNLIVVNFFI